ncbi:MAG: radical SAM protein [Candidatus Omnitrophota bacterium]
MQNRILLVKPFIPKSSHSQDMFPPTSLGFLAHALKTHGIEYGVFDMGLGYSFRQLVDKIHANRPTHLGVTLFTYQYKAVFQLLKQVKTVFPYLVIIAGGPHISTFREEAMRECGDISYGVVLEGEGTLVQLMNGKDLADIKGLLFRKGQEIVFTGNPDSIVDLDSEGFPHYEGFELEKYSARPKLMTINTTRGCPYQCIYCPVGTTIGKNLRYRSPESVIEEIRYWYDKGYRIIEIMDDNFTFKMERVFSVCELLEKEEFRNLVLNIPNGVRADKVNPHLLNRLRQVGFKVISFGVEAGSEAVLKSLKKGEDLATIKQAIRWAVDAGLEVRLFFLIGSPTERIDDFKNSIKIAEEFAVSGAYFYNIIPYPKTELYDWISQNNYFIQKPQDYLNQVSGLDNNPVFETPQMNKEERIKAFRYAKSIEKRIYRRNIQIKLKKLRILAYPVAWFYSLEFIQRLLSRSARFRHLIYRLSCCIRHSN